MNKIERLILENYTDFEDDEDIEDFVNRINDMEMFRGSYNGNPSDLGRFGYAYFTNSLAFAEGHGKAGKFKLNIDYPYIIDSLKEYQTTWSINPPINQLKNQGYDCAIYTHKSKTAGDIVIVIVADKTTVTEIK